MIRSKAVPSGLDPLSYESLRQQILRRDGWRCQSCGTMSNLEVHHKEFRSHSGAASEENLITLCAVCHARVHRPLGHERVVPDTVPAQGAESTAVSLAEIIPPASRFCRAPVPDGDIGNGTGEPRTPPRLARELPLIHDTALIGPLVPNA